MILGVSVGKGFDDYGAVYSQLSSIDFTELCTVDNELVSRFAKESNSPCQVFSINWNDVRDAKNVKQNKWGKLYNADAPAEAAQKLVDYCDKIIEFAGGDYNISKLGKSKLLKQQEVITEKRYQL